MTRASSNRLLALLVLLATAGSLGAAPMTIFVSIPPLAQLVEALGGADVAVSVLVPPGQSPHGYEPSPRQMAALSRARLLLHFGTVFERRMVEKISGLHPELAVRDVGAELPRRAMAGAGHEAHDAHGGHDAHGHACPCHGAATDPHVWLDPRNVAALTEPVARALEPLLPGRAEALETRAQAFRERAQRLEARLSLLLAPCRGKRFYVHHPAFGYFAERFGLEQVAVELEGKTPSPRHLARLIRQARADGVRVLFVQAQFSDAAARTVAAAIGGRVVPLDPLSPDWLGGLETMGERIAEAYAPEARTP